MTPKIPTRLPELTLRFAEESDVPLVLSFIKKLADYEKLALEVVTDEVTLHRSLFGERRVAEVILGDYDDQPVAFALFFHNFSTFLGRPGLYLEDLFVDPAMRGRGIGQIMLSYLAHLAVKRGCGRLEWWVLDWNESAIKFYKRLGASPMNEWTVYRVTGPTLAQLAQEF
jgi:GNAT superfamily N-acetyltransferase